jgi:energy-coupling factor transport system substrate-specific component
MRRIVSGMIYGLSGAIGVLAFLYPFFVPVTTRAAHGMAHSQDAPLVTAALVGLSVIALIVELQGQAISAKTVAMLGVLVAITSVLRFIEVAIPMPGGFSPIFAPIILAGYVFGSRFGFLMGAFTFLVSSLITGGVGPWLPYQMFTAGWAGLMAGWVARLMPHGSHLTGHARRFRESLEILILCIFGFLWGLLYGAILNIWFWPFAVGPAEQTWSSGIGLGETLARYGTFYLVTSLAWDMARAVGNGVLILLLGAPVVRALTRFRRRFHFEVYATDA